MLNESPWVKSNTDIRVAMEERFAHLKRGMPRSTIIYTQNEPAEYLHFLLEGRVNVFLLNRSGELKTLAIHEPGSFFGEASFFERSSYFASAVAAVDSSILRFDAMAAAELFASASPIPLHLLRSLGQKIRLLTFQVESMTFLSVKKRVGATLLGLFENFGKTEEDGFRLDIQITDQELAYLIGTRREAVTKAIVELKNLGFLHKEKRVLYFDDVKALKEFVTEDED